MNTKKLGPKGWIGVGVGVLALVVGMSATAAQRNAADPSADLDVTPSAAHSSPSATPTPVLEFRTVSEEEPIPFAATTAEDAARDAGTSAVVTAGVPGVRTKTYMVTLTDGVETARKLVSETVVRPPVDQVTAIGTRQAPPAPPAAAPAPSGCDPNYSGACVPIASDVDCAGGSGNGPAYVQGPVQVIGKDIYDLDRKGNGIGCE